VVIFWKMPVELLSLVGRAVPADGAELILGLASEDVAFAKSPVLLLEAKGMEVPDDGACVVSCMVPLAGVAVASTVEDPSASVDVLLVYTASVVALGMIPEEAPVPVAADSVEDTPGTVLLTYTASVAAVIVVLKP